MIRSAKHILTRYLFLMFTILVLGNPLPGLASTYDTSFPCTDNAQCLDYYNSSNAAYSSLKVNCLLPGSSTCAGSPKTCKYYSMCSGATPACVNNKCCVADTDKACGCGGKTRCDGSCVGGQTCATGQACVEGTCCSPEYGKPCGHCGGTYKCDGTCSTPDPVNWDKPCGHCGGKFKCDGTCSISDPADWDRDCGQCGGKIRCDGSCSVTDPANVGLQCGRCGGLWQCDGSCPAACPDGKTCFPDRGCYYPEKCGDGIDNDHNKTCDDDCYITVYAGWSEQNENNKGRDYLITTDPNEIWRAYNRAPRQKFLTSKTRIPGLTTDWELFRCYNNTNGYHFIEGDTNTCAPQNGLTIEAFYGYPFNRNPGHLRQWSTCVWNCPELGNMEWMIDSPSCSGERVRCSHGGSHTPTTWTDEPLWLPTDACWGETVPGPPPCPSGEHRCYDGSCCTGSCGGTPFRCCKSGFRWCGNNSCCERCCGKVCC